MTSTGRFSFTSSKAQMINACSWQRNRTNKIIYSLRRDSLMILRVVKGVMVVERHHMMKMKAIMIGYIRERSCGIGS